MLMGAQYIWESKSLLTGGFEQEVWGSISRLEYSIVQVDASDLCPSMLSGTDPVSGSLGPFGCIGSDNITAGRNLRGAG